MKRHLHRLYLPLLAALFISITEYSWTEDPSSAAEQAWLKAAAIRDAATTGGMTVDTVASLVSEVGPRMAGTDADQRAIG